MMWSLGTFMCLFFVITLPGCLADIWNHGYRNKNIDRPSFLGLPDLLRGAWTRQSRDPSPEHRSPTVKRGDRYSINDLIAYLKGMVGSDEIYHTGRSTYVRWGAGG
ncbi:uncharacterized protein LOC111129111 [Crassostrea virginica]|uniref:Uncharacterized protein LOC111129111 n=1 Tax=Crassostrea virginica TaxID=6565 RepID=A0A8B8E6E8_CRAVI|nr:uncharacterized protein LOC111129111 [Crassostrea virginica]XP_022335259.1 uncharacterized protein LOC111131827 [Crassostrea virginica]